MTPKTRWPEPSVPSRWPLPPGAKPDKNTLQEAFDAKPCAGK